MQRTEWNSLRSIKLQTTQFITVFVIYFILSYVKAEHSQLTKNQADPALTDGELFIKKLVHGEKISDNPGILLFTAPYRICSGGCNDTGKNLVMSFPIYVGIKGKQMYKKMYSRDVINIHSMRPDAPFRQRTTRMPMTKCPTLTTTTTTTTEPTTKTTTSTTSTTTMTPTPTPTTTTTTTTEATTTLEPLRCPPILFLVLPALCGKSNEHYFPWDKWTWSLPQQPDSDYLRRHAEMPIKAPNFECQCPPKRECVIEFKLNPAMIDFMALRGILNEEEVKEKHEEIMEQEKSMTINLKDQLLETRVRRSDDDIEENCCCPPRTAMMPTFITDKKFDEVVKNLKKKQLHPSLYIHNS